MTVMSSNRIDTFVRFIWTKGFFLLSSSRYSITFFLGSNGVRSSKPSDFTAILIISSSDTYQPDVREEWKRGEALIEYLPQGISFVFVRSIFLLPIERKEVLSLQLRSQLLLLLFYLHSCKPPQMQLIGNGRKGGKEGKVC